MRAINPATGEVICEFSWDSATAVEQALERAHQAFAGSLATTSPQARAGWLCDLAKGLESEQEALARLMSQEMGKPLVQGRAEVAKCAATCRWFAENGPAWLADEPVATDSLQSFVRPEPLGVILAIMPWNFPLWQLFRFAAPALLAGNAVALKHAPNVPGCARAIAELFARAGCPSGTLVNLAVDIATVPGIIADRRIAGVTLTGSVGAGRAVASMAGSALKRCVLELGGSDPFVVLADCDLERTVAQALWSRTLNNGQSCIAAKRFIVEAPVYEAFCGRLAEGLARLVVGDPMREDTEIGPLARADLRETLHRQVQATLAQGARLVVGGHLPQGPGFYYPPTLLTEVAPHMTAFREETFGPVAAVTMARDVEEAIALANDTVYGLGASLWTTPQRGQELAARLQCGHVAVNEIVRSDARMPFGGIRDSGFGRELGRQGMMEFVNWKAVRVSPR